MNADAIWTDLVSIAPFDVGIPKHNSPSAHSSASVKSVLGGSAREGFGR